MTKYFSTPVVVDAYSLPFGDDCDALMKWEHWLFTVDWEVGDWLVINPQGCPFIFKEEGFKANFMRVKENEDE